MGRGSRNSTRFRRRFSAPARKGCRRFRVSLYRKLDSSRQCSGLAPALAACGSVFAISQNPEKDKLIPGLSHLLVRFIREYPGSANRRSELAAEIVRRIEPLVLARDLVRAFQTLDFATDMAATATGKPREPTIGWSFVEEEFLRRVRTLAEADPAALFIEGADAEDLLTAWHDVRKSDLSDWLEQELARVPAYSVPLLRRFWPVSVVDVIPPSVLKTALLQHFGPALRDMSVRSPEVLLARDFLEEYDRDNTVLEPIVVSSAK